MRARKLTPEDLCEALRRLECGEGMNVLCEEYDISAATLYAGRRLYSGLPCSVVKRMQALSLTNARLQKQVRDLEGDNQALRAALLRNKMTPAQRRELVIYLTRQLGIAHTKACRFANISRSFFAYQDQMEVMAQQARQRDKSSSVDSRYFAKQYIGSATVRCRVVVIEETRDTPVEANGHHAHRETADETENDD